MPSAHETVAAMRAEAASGRTPRLLEDFLRAQFPERMRGWFARWLLPPRSYDVGRLEPFEDGGFFRASCLFWAFAADDLLEGTVLPSGGTCGLFALGGGGLRYLHHHPEHLQRLLGEEARPLEQCPPLVLARLTVEALARRGNMSHDVLESARYLAEYQGELGGFGGEYRLDPKAWERVKDRIDAPTLAGDGRTGWELRFTTLSGWMHEKQRLVAHRVRFDAAYRVEHQMTLLSKRVFSALPALRY